MNTALSYFRPTETSQKSILKRQAYIDKLKERKASQFDITAENEKDIWHSLSQSIFSIGYAAFHTKALQRKGAVPEDDVLVKYADLLKKKFETFKKFLRPEKQEEYIATRNVMEDFFFRVATANADELNRTIKFLESIQNKRK